MILRIFGSVFAVLIVIAGAVQAFETNARNAMVVDLNTGTILLSKNADTAYPPASMSKLMTLNMVFEALEDGRITMDETFRVSAKASQKGGSKMFVREGERVSVEDLIRGVIIQSGNDACIVLAEGLSGTEAEFAEDMTIRAQELGMMNSNFVNSTGWPDPGQKMSAEDLVYLSIRLITVFPEYYGYFSETSFTWDGIVQENRNPLLSMGIGADGLKTGHTEEAGYGLVGSVEQDGRRIVFMFGGLQSAAARAQEAERIARWAFRDFAMKTLFEAGEEVDTVGVWLGETERVGMALEQDIELLLPLETLDDITAEYKYTDPVEAPVRAGQALGELIIDIPDMDELRYPLVATSDVAPGGFVDRLNAAVDIVLIRIRTFTSGS